MSHFSNDSPHLPRFNGGLYLVAFKPLYPLESEEKDMITKNIGHCYHWSFFTIFIYIYIYSYYLSYIIFPNISLTSLMSQKNPTSASPGRPRKISLAPKTPVFGIPTTGTKKNSTVRHDFLFISDIPIVGWWNTNSIHMFYDVLWIARITRR